MEIQAIWRALSTPGKDLEELSLPHFPQERDRNICKMSEGQPFWSIPTSLKHLAPIQKKLNAVLWPAL